MSLTSIADRLTPSVPIELTFGQQPIATGRKFTTIFGHMAASPGTATPYQVYTVQNVGDPSLAKAEVDVLAGSDSQIGKMAYAFVNANVLGGFGNFPAFRVVMIPFGVNNFGPNSEAIDAVKFLRTDMFVSCYPGSDSTNEATLLALVTLISGIDRDLSGQFGSFMTLGSLAPLVTQEAYNYNSQYVIVASLPDSNTASVPLTGTVTSASPIITAISQSALTPTGTVSLGSFIVTTVSSVAGIYPGAAITGANIPSGTTIETISGTSLTMSAAATGAGSGQPLSIVNLPTAGVYIGAVLTGTGIPALTTVLSVTSSTITMSANATVTGVSEAIGCQNAVSQNAEIVASVSAANMMGSVFPYIPMNSVVAGGLIPPRKQTDWIEINPNGASEAALTAGLSPMVVRPDGTVAFLRTRTTYTMNGLAPVTAYFDWQDLVIMNDFREVIFLITQNPPFNGNPGGTKTSVTTAQLLKNEVMREAQSFENQGAFQGVQALADLFVVQPSTTSRGRLDFYIPVNVIPGLMVIAGNIQGVSNIGNFTL